ncbi:MAG: pitrilysin family protein [Chitinophagales bacterium]|jgi:predicted Zn-dependent peptidase
MTIPSIHDIEKIVFPAPESSMLKNNIPLFGFNGTKNDVLRIELVFNSGRWTEPAKLIAESTARLFKSGTAGSTSFELNEQIDSYGSTIRTSAGYNTFNVSVYCMNRFLEPSLQLLKTCLTEIIFPEQELQLMQKNALSKLKVSQEKNDYLADVAFKKTVFGEHHPYGYETTEDAIRNITQALLLQFYKQDIQPNNCTVFIAGKYGQKELSLIENYLGGWEAGTEQPTAFQPKPSVSGEQQKIHLRKEKSVQASIIIGKEFFNKHHEDYAAFLLLNTIFGGYFGSRLMSNIREDKGLTYGIHSGLSTLKHSGVFAIQTDTNLENLDICLREIYLEAERLQNEKIPAREITLARNYLLGKFLGRTDGPFNQMEVQKSYYIENIPINKFEVFVETIKQTDALSLQHLAQKYLSRESMFEVVVG